MKLKIIILSLLISSGIFSPTYLRAETPSVQVQVDRDTLTTDETLNLSIIIKGGSALTTPDIPSRNNFDVVGQSSGNSIEIINGEMSVTKSFEFVLRPRKKGIFTIGPVKAHIDGQTYSSPPLKVTVLESDKTQSYVPLPPRPQAQPQIPQVPGTPGRSWPPFGSQTNQVPQTKRATTFLTAELDKKSAYVGEQVLFTFRLYSAVSIANAQLSLPKFKDFISEELIKERKYEVNLDGNRYAVNEWRLALFPTKAGNLQTGVSKVTGEVPVALSSRYPFNDPFFQGFPRQQRRTLRTFQAPSNALEVKELPPPPSGFTGLVGQFTLMSHLTQDRLNMGDTTNLEVEISGNGNIREANLPPLPSTPFFKVYPGKPSVVLDKSLKGLGGKKKFSYALVAERPGQTTLPTLGLFYFDPQTGVYEKLSTPPQTVQIQGTKGKETLVTAGIEDPKEFLSDSSRIFDLAELKNPRDILYSQKLPTWQSLLWWLLLLGSPLLYMSLILNEKRKLRALANVEDRKRSKAFKRAKSSLGHSLGRNGEDISTHLMGILKGYLGDRFLVKAKALTPLEVESLLQSNKIPTEVIRRMVYLLEQLDSWKYGGLAEILPSEKELKTEIINVLREIEKAA